MFIISIYDYNDASGERFMYEEFNKIGEAVKQYNDYIDSFDKADKPYIVLLYTKTGNIIYGF